MTTTRRAPPTAAELAAMNARLMSVEKTVGESFLELKHNQVAHGAAISGMQQDMHKLVAIAEKQIELQHESRQQSTAIDRAFKDMKENREELLAAIREAGRSFSEWRNEHERKFGACADTVNSHKTGVRIIWAVFSVMALSSVAWLFVQFERVHETIAAGDARLRQEIVAGDASNTRALENHAIAAAAAERRIETRLERLEYPRGGR